MADLTATTATLEAAFELLRAIKADAADGVTLTDLTSNMTPGPARDAVTKIGDNIGGVEAELVDLDWREALELGQETLAQVRTLA